jgi:hypothetical protein
MPSDNEAPDALVREPRAGPMNLKVDDVVKKIVAAADKLEADKRVQIHMGDGKVVFEALRLEVTKIAKLLDENDRFHAVVNPAHVYKTKAKRTTVAPIEAALCYYLFMAIDPAARDDLTDGVEDNDAEELWRAIETATKDIGDAAFLVRLKRKELAALSLRKFTYKDFPLFHIDLKRVAREMRGLGEAFTEQELHDTILNVFSTEEKFEKQIEDMGAYNLESITVNHESITVNHSQSQSISGQSQSITVNIESILSQSQSISSQSQPISSQSQSISSQSQSISSQSQSISSQSQSTMSQSQSISSQSQSI